MSSLWYFDPVSGRWFVDVDVVKRIALLIEDQRVFFHTRNKALLQSCKQREDDFLLWWEASLERMENYTLGCQSSKKNPT